MHFIYTHNIKLLLQSVTVSLIKINQTKQIKWHSGSCRFWYELNASPRSQPPIEIVFFSFPFYSRLRISKRFVVIMLCRLARVDRTHGAMCVVLASVSVYCFGLLLMMISFHFGWYAYGFTLFIPDEMLLDSTICADRRDQHFSPENKVSHSRSLSRCRDQRVSLILLLRAACVYVLAGVSIAVCMRWLEECYVSHLASIENIIIIIFFRLLSVPFLR